MKIYLIRHGQTTGDLENKYGGIYNDHLTELGKKQASELAEILSEKGIEKIFTSPYFRAKETAEIFKQKLNLQVEIVENFRERNHYGILSGMVKEVAKEKFPEEVEKVKSYVSCAEGGEEYEPFKKRVEGTLKEITNTNLAVVAVVTHGGVIREIFRETLKFGEIDFGEQAYAVIEYKDGIYKLLETNSITKQ